MSGILGSLIGAAANIGSTVINNNMSRENYALAARQNYQYGEMAASNAFLRQMSYYNNFLSPAAQVDQLRKAGLSPGLIYSHGMSGSSGISAPQGNGASGNQPQMFPFDLMSNALIAAQIANVKADTKKKEAEAGNIGQQTFNLKTENEKLVTEIGNIAVQTENYKVQRRLYSLQADYQEIINYYGKVLNEKQLTSLQSQIEYTNEQTRSLMLSNEITDASKQELIKQNQIQNSLALSQIVVNNAQKKLTEQETQQVYESIKQSYLNIGLQAGKLRLETGQLVNEAERTKILKQHADNELLKINNEFQLGLDKNRLEAMAKPLYSSYLLFMQSDSNFKEIEDIIHKQP